MVERIKQDRVRFDAQRRLAYRVSGSLGMLLVLYAQFTLLTDSDLSYLSRAVFAINHSVLASFSCWVIWTLRRGRMLLDAVERIMLWFFAFESICFNSVLPPLFGQSVPVLLRETIGDDIWFILVICTLVLHLYSGRRGILMALGFYLFSFTVAAGQVLMADARGQDGGSGVMVIQIYVMAGALLCFLFVIARYRDHMQRLQVEYELLEQMAFNDVLTGLPNRRMGYQVLQSQIALARRGAHPLCVCLWDIDHFKQINDTYGHEVGDMVLHALAEHLTTIMRVSDMLIRWGGEEFVVVLPETPFADALIVAERLRGTIAELPMAWDVRATASFGVSCYDGIETLEHLLQRADLALYKAKASGRNMVMPQDTIQTRTAF
ncbi:MAG: diguanylate cyclase [Chloroflexales bacterium]|jgi:diguanylate cyclase